jgi:hypothetical protein
VSKSPSCALSQWWVTGSWLPRRSRSAGRGPVLILRVVEAELDALLAALFGELAQRVALEGRGGDDVEGVGLGVEHGEAVVVLGGDDDVLHAGGFGEGDDIVRAEAGGVELRREGLVVGDGDGGVVHDPLADAREFACRPRCRRGWSRGPSG